jgi:hypothetical protein
MPISLTSSGATLSASGSVTFPSSFGDLSGLGFPLCVGLPNAKFVNNSLSGSSTGNNNVYTVPTGKRAYILQMTVRNLSGGLASFQMMMDIGGTYYPLGNASGTISNNFNEFLTALVPYVAEAGETFAVNASAQPFQTWATIIEFDDTAGLKSPKITSFINGDNTVYTVPASKSAMVITQALLTAPLGIGTGASANAFCYANTSGATRTINWNQVPSGSSVGNSNLLSNSASSVPSSGIDSIWLAMAMDTGDFTSVNSNSNASGQLAWITVIEI